MHTAALGRQNFYSMLFAVNPDIDMLLELIGIADESQDNPTLAKVCDAFIENDGSKVFFLTRNGGRAFYKTADEAESNVKDNRFYVGKKALEQDDSYVYYEFDIPVTAKIAGGGVINPREKISQKMQEWNKTVFDDRARILGDFKNKRKTPEVNAIVEKMKKVLNPIVKNEDSVTIVDDSGVKIEVSRLSLE